MDLGAGARRRPREEPFAGAPGGTRQVQYFDKGRMEVNPGGQRPEQPLGGDQRPAGGRTGQRADADRADSLRHRAPADVPVAGEPPAPGDARGADL